jgi:hypothetical protein
MISGWQAFLTMFGFIALAYLVAVWVGFVVWTYRDVRGRSADPTERMAAVLLVALFSAPGWLVYLLLRPSETLDEVRIEQLETQLFSRELASTTSCTRCRRRVGDDFLMCPYCREALRVPCENCARPVSTLWAACAYCGETRPRPVVAASAVRPRVEPRPSRAATPPPLIAREVR